MDNSVKVSLTSLILLEYLIMNTKLIVVAVMLAGAFTLVAVLNNHKDSTSPTTENLSAEVTIPENFPNDIPMYPESILDRVQDIDQSGERNITLTLKTPDAVNEVIAWYRANLNANDLHLVSDKNVGGYTLLEGERDNIKIFVQAATIDDTTSITERIRIR